MKGLELSRSYFNSVVLPHFRTDFPAVFERSAAGLAGNGSECFGYDDETSRDHDWGVDYFIWVSEDQRAVLPQLNAWRVKLFAEEPPEFARHQSEYGARIGAMTVGDFYKSLIGFPEGPDTILDWRRIPEDNLAMVVNGDVFMDNAGDFSRIREKILGYYPEEYRKKRLAARCMAIAQTGQYNHMRMAKRGDLVTARVALNRFHDNVVSMVFLLNKRFKPYYKWAFRMMSGLPVLGAEIAPLLTELAVSPMTEGALPRQQELVSKITGLLISELHIQGLAFSDDWFMTTHGEEIQRSITDEILKTLPAQYE